ncbi:uncharacterized protein LOC116341445 isoform X1 [Contarinia nasturtii]|uniref:uncharacterized protein LOC116341445 isoform X1 n=1 Tax=Contarinia nasturtii TaxID=265458 RepID=UPI0012D4A335|nr:uncharacterized protein LOC116341445 isoform X1 [Contarinia nasturtii]
MMDSVNVPLRSSGKKMRKRRELDALVAHSLAKRACNSGKRQAAGNGINSQDQLLSVSTDDQEEYSLSKIQIAKRHRKHYSFLRTCVPLLFIFSVFLLISLMYWLYFDLREQLSEHRTKLEQASAICSNMPETLHKLHESLQTLEQNQTAIGNKIYEIQQRIETVEKEFTQLKDSIRKGDGPDGDKAIDLKNTVSGFGAKIQALETDVKTIKEGYSGIQSAQQSDKVRLDALQNSVDSIKNASQSNFTSGLQNETLSWMKNLTDKCSNDLKNVSSQLAALNDRYSEKIKSINDEMHDHKNKLDSLTENFANVSSHVNSIESEWPKFMLANRQLDSLVTRVNSDVMILKSNLSSFDATLRDLLVQQQEAKKEHDSNVNNAMFGESNGLQASQNESKVTGFPSEILTGGETMNSTNPQPITPQPVNNNTQSSPSTAAASSSTTVP